MNLTGSCLCGAVRYVVDGEPKFISKCYCRDCQKESGTGHVTALSVSDAAVRVTGEFRQYTKAGGSGLPVARTFCPACGTTLFAQGKVLPGFTLLRAGTLDAPSSFKPGMAVFTSRAQAWDAPPADLHRFDEMPPPAPALSTPGSR